MISGKTKLIAHVGYPTESFRAPMIYNPYFKKHAIDAVVDAIGSIDPALRGVGGRVQQAHAKSHVCFSGEAPSCRPSCRPLAAAEADPDAAHAERALDSLFG
mgnify:CR=1 FL=1